MKPISPIPAILFVVRAGVFVSLTINGLFEATRDLAPGVTTEQLLQDPLGQDMNSRRPVAWGHEEATPKALTRGRCPVAPDGSLLVDPHRTLHHVFAQTSPRRISSCRHVVLGFGEDSH